ncbi:hypothetical protein BKA67DRAFT_664376 [Truncatella angustata]|uniref:DUF8004 domain-containing protein n=1 Tax=Truncatella angustata TaxID=152316 RepID=A0A9P8RGA1_9PEZI|nr:uncharacterized protein BKA67DRAFT_664376 [Truncatella angustata]KAH6645269.1 hypothetical protein BKA67DRAFT_664376 [Truncatella angustata]KAH8200579.1 hypothetical protein TruAng_005231 [Truncatella angustata]
MSGRSAYVRKKITETKVDEKKPVFAGRGGLRSPDLPGGRGLDYDDGTFVDYSPASGTGYGTTNGRFLKFSDTLQSDFSPLGPSTTISTYSGGSQSGGSDAGRRDGTGLKQGPMDSFAYARVRRPTIKTEDVSGIERSGFRSNIDKKSDDIRKGLSKAFGFGKKSKKATDDGPRTQSAAGISGSGGFGGYEAEEIPPIPTLHSSQLPGWGANNDLPPPPTSKLPAIPISASSPTIKRWVGAGRPVQRWNKLRKDPELWDPNGDVLVYLARRGQSPRPNASFRLSSHIIEATESRFLTQLMREGSTEEDFNVPPSPAGAFSRHGLGPHQGYSHHGRGHPTPPVSDDASNADIDGQISYEMYFPTPPEFTRSEAHRYVITTRNVFALLYHTSLVGLSLHQALTDLYVRLESYMPSEADNVGTILNYLSVRALDDCRNDPETAVSLLSWSESQTIRWEEGWREAFLHSAGMYARLETCADWKQVTPITRALLERACLETQLRVQAAEERLTEFSYADMWPPSGPIANSSSKSAADRLQKFLISYFTTTFGEWPPPPSDERSPDGEETWLTRGVAQKLQKDFGALYDYLVNRDISWDESETRSSRKWMMVSESGNKAFDADTMDLPMTDLLIEWDIRSRFPHIPYPYPLVPESIPLANPTTRDKPKKSDKDKNRGAEDRVLERRVQLAYTEATNIYILGSDFVQSELIDNFVRFEKSDQVGGVDPLAARRGRWVLIYGILQTLATVSVDAPNVRYKNEVDYHLSPRLKGTRVPPWKGVSNSSTEACHELSHCWVVPRTWNAAQDSEASDELSPITRMMRAHGHNFPHPPPTVTTARSTTSGWQTPARSVRSSAWGGSSAMSTVSDDARSVRTAATSLHRVRSKDGLKGLKAFGAGRSSETAAGVSDWPVQSQSVKHTRNSDAASTSSRPLPPLTINPSVTGGGGFLDLDESPPQASRKRSTNRMKAPRNGDDMLDMIIKDFDELEAISDHDP